MIENTSFFKYKILSAFKIYFSVKNNCLFFSLRRGDLIRRCCPSVGWSVLNFLIFCRVRSPDFRMVSHFQSPDRRLNMQALSVCRLVRLSVLDFVIFQKRGFEIINLTLSNTTKLILLDSLLQEVTAPEIQITTFLIHPSLYCLIHFYKCIYRYH